jgi:hypothetical protein
MPLSLAFHGLLLTLFSRSNSQQFTMSQLSDMRGNTDMSLNMMLWSRGGERPDGLAIAPQKQDG